MVSGRGEGRLTQTAPGVEGMQPQSCPHGLALRLTGPVP